MGNPSKLIDLKKSHTKSLGYGACVIWYLAMIIFFGAIIQYLIPDD